MEIKQGGDRKTTVISKGHAVSSPPPSIEEPSSASPIVSTGTCFAINERGDLLTAYHVVEGADQVSVRFADGEVLQASLEGMSRGADIAVLHVERETPEFLALDGEVSQRVGESVFTMSFPAAGELSEEPTFSEGAIAGLTGPGGDATLIRITVPVQPENSGAPLVNERGEVVGIITSTAASEAGPDEAVSVSEGANCAVNVDYAIPLVGEGSVVAPVGSREEAIDRARAAVCRVDASRLQETTLTRR